MKTAIILFNLGGPDSLAAVQPFLFNLFRDKAILRLPLIVRYPLALMISTARNETAQKIYASIGGASPLLKNTYAQAEALEKALNTDKENKFRTFIAMRYWHPFAEATAREVKKFGPDHIIYLPLYPQFSTTTTKSSFQDFDRALAPYALPIQRRVIREYPVMPGFIEAMAARTREALESFPQKPRLLFSAHGLPEKIVAAGDPYQKQCEQTAAALASALGLAPADWVLCYQSRVGPLAWIGPSTEEEIERAGKDGVPILIVPIAFVSENSETLYEIDRLYQNLAAQKSVPHFGRAQTAGTHPAFIEGLAGLVRQRLQSKPL